jgi:hypothetical protein
MTILDSSNSQILELGRECLLRYLLHLLSSNLEIILTSPLIAEISKEAYFSTGANSISNAFGPNFTINFAELLRNPDFCKNN